jgi:uncharacterized phiE125 gp8 family phage protein
MAHVRVDHDEEDHILLAYLGAAVDHAESVCRRPLLAGDYIADGLTLPTPPDAAVSVSKVEFRDAAGDFALVPAEQYRVEDNEVRPLNGFPRSTDYRVHYCALYKDTPGAPKSVKLAVMLLAGHWYAQREATIVGVSMAEIPFGIKALLFPYRELGW